MADLTNKITKAARVVGKQLAQVAQTPKEKGISPAGLVQAGFDNLLKSKTQTPTTTTALTQKNGGLVEKGGQYVYEGKPTSERSNGPVRKQNEISAQGVGVSEEIAKLVSDPNALKKQKPTDRNSDRPVTGRGDNHDRQDDFQDTISEEENYTSGEVVDQDDSEEKYQEMLNKICAALRDKKIIITTDEAEQLLKADFKTKFPWIMLSMNVAKGFQDVTAILLSLSFFSMGSVGEFTAMITSWIPILNLITGLLGGLGGLTLQVIGLVMGMLELMVNAVYQVILFAWSYYYANNAVDFSTKITFLKKLTIRYIIQRSWILIFGTLPLVGPVLDILFTIFVYMYIRKVCAKVKEVIDNNKEALQG